MNQLVLQTPRLPRDNHPFRLTYLGPELDNTSTIQISALVVQNTTDGFNPEVFPVLLQQADARPSSFSINDRHALIAGTILGSVFIILILALTMWFLRHRHNRRKSEDIQPFWAGHIFQYPFVPKERGRAGGKSSSLRPEFNGGQDSSTESAAERGVTSVVYMVHQDGGNLVANSQPPAAESRMIVELPPVYSAIRTPPTHRPDSAALTVRLAPVPKRNVEQRPDGPVSRVVGTSSGHDP